MRPAAHMGPRGPRCCQWGLTRVLCPTVDGGCVPLTHRHGCPVCPRMVVRITGGDLCDSCKGGGPASVWALLPGCSGPGRAPPEVGEPGLHVGVWTTHAGCCPPLPFCSQLGGLPPCPLSLSSPSTRWLSGCVPHRRRRGVLLTVPSLPPPDAPRGGSSPKWENPASGSRIWAWGLTAPQTTVCPPVFPGCSGGTQGPERSCNGPKVTEQGWPPASLLRIGARLGLGPCRQ